MCSRWPEEFLNKEIPIYYIESALRFIWTSGVSHHSRSMTVIIAIKVFPWKRRGCCLISEAPADIMA